MIYFIALLTCVCIVQLFYLYKFVRIILRMEDSLEESLDVIDSSYNRISIILEKPLFYDSTEVRQILSELNNTKTSLLYVANVMTGQKHSAGDEVD